MAEGILKDKFRKAGVSGIEVCSAGTMGLEGEGPAPFAEEICHERGIDISGHVARRMTADMVNKSDLVIVMEMEQFQWVVELASNAGKKTRLLSRYGAEGTKFQESIPDPYGKNRLEYESCFNLIKRHIAIMYEEDLREA